MSTKHKAHADARQKMIAAGIRFLDAALPPLEQLAPLPREVESRADALVRLNVEAA